MRRNVTLHALVVLFRCVALGLEMFADEHTTQNLAHASWCHTMPRAAGLQRESSATTIRRAVCLDDIREFCECLSASRQRNSGTTLYPLLCSHERQAQALGGAMDRPIENLRTYGQLAHRLSSRAVG